MESDSESSIDATRLSYESHRSRKSSWSVNSMHSLRQSRDSTSDNHSNEDQEMNAVTDGENDQVQPAEALEDHPSMIIDNDYISSGITLFCN